MRLTEDLPMKHSPPKGLLAAQNVSSKHQALSSAFEPWGPLVPDSNYFPKTDGRLKWPVLSQLKLEKRDVGSGDSRRASLKARELDGPDLSCKQESPTG